MSRIKYFVYYLLKTDWHKFSAFLRYASAKTGQSKLSLLCDIFISSFKYNMSFLDYFIFYFFEHSNAERRQWAGTGFMYEYQLHMNPKGSRGVLADKIQFLQHFKAFIRRDYASLKSLKEDRAKALHLLGNPSGRLVLKGSLGQSGEQVEVVKTNDFTPERLLRYMHEKGYDLAEEYVLQHPALMALSPSGLNTVRVTTQLHDGKVEFLAAALRISVNSLVDNVSAGGLGAPVDPATGAVTGPAVYYDISKKDETHHPVTGQAIQGLHIPFWQETLAMLTRAALHTPQNRSIGWDVAITSEGPQLIEGNHNWNHLMVQLVEKRGLKSRLEKYL